MKTGSKTNLFAQKHYALFSLFATLLMLIPISLYLMLSSSDLRQGLLGVDIMLVRAAIAIGIIVFMILFLPGGKLALGREHGIIKGLLYGLPYLGLSALTTIISNVNVDIGAVEMPSAAAMLLFIINMLFLGFNEEFLFRGLILNNLFIGFGKTDAALKKAVWISSAFFGFMHIANIFVSSVPTTLMQMIMAVFGGVLFCGIYLKSKSIWVAVIIHALLDIIAFMPSVMNVGSVLSVQYKWYEGLIVMAAGALIQLGYGLLLLKNLKAADLQKQH